MHSVVGVSSCPQAFFEPPHAPCRVQDNLCECFCVDLAITWDAASSGGHKPWSESRFLSFYLQTFVNEKCNGGTCRGPSSDRRIINFSIAAVLKGIILLKDIR